MKIIYAVISGGMFRVNHLLMAVFGLPTIIMFVYEDRFEWFSNEVFKFVVYLGVGIVTLMAIYEMISILFSRSVIYCRDSADVTSEMVKIIREEGHTWIMSSNLSWARDNEAFSALLTHAEMGDLTICVNEKNSYVEQLERAGAKINLYESVIKPKCRFTIKGHGNSGSRIYISKPNSDGKNIIHRYSAKDDLVLLLAEDISNVRWINQQ